MRLLLRRWAPALPAALAAMAFATTDASAMFTGASPTASLSVSTMTPTAASGVSASVCSVIPAVGIVDNRVTISWTAVGAADLTGYVILVNGVASATLPVGRTSWTDGNLLAIGSVRYQVRAVYGTAGAWSADSAPVTVTYTLGLPGC